MKTLGFKLFFIIYIFLFIFSCSNKKEEEIVRIVFYKVPNDVAENVKSVLRKQFSNNDEKLELVFEEINKATKLKERVEKDENVSLIFSNSIHLPFENAKTVPFDVSLYETFPSCIKRYSFGTLEKNAEGASALPILLDSYHLFFNNTVLEEQNRLIFRNTYDFSNMLKSFSSNTKYPFMCAGGEDETLLFFVANVMQMVGDVYSLKNKKISSIKDRDEVFNNALELIVEWQKNGFLHPEWFRLKHKDISIFMGLKEIGVLFTQMSEYKKNESKQFYSLMPMSFPLSKNSPLNGLPISVLSIIKPIQKEEATSEDKNSYISKIIEYCISIEGQKNLSDKTGFNSSSMSNTSQSSATSVRYLLATVSVVLEDAGTILFEDSNDTTILANEIREYFQANGVGY